MKTALIARRRRQGGGALFAIWLDDVEAAHGTAMTAVDFSAVLRSGPYSLADEYDALIDGLTLNTTTGVLSGTPTDRRGRGWHEIRVQDAVGNTAGMRMCSVPDINPANYATAFDGTVINTEQTVSGGTGDLLLANLEINDRLNIHSWSGGIITIYNPTVDTEAAANDGIRVSTSGDAENLTIYGGTFNTGLNGIIVAEDTGVTHPGLRILNTRMIATGLSEGPTNKHGIYNQAPDALLEGNSFGPDDDYPDAEGMQGGSAISTRSGSVARGNRIRQCKNDGIGYYADHPGAGTSLLTEQNDIDDVNLSDTGRNAINLIALNAGTSPPAVAANLIDDATIRNNLIGDGFSVQVAADYANNHVTVTIDGEVVATSEVWPPSGVPDLYFDFDLGEGYWGGQARTTSDMANPQGNAYGIEFVDLGLTPNAYDYVMMIDVDYPDGYSPAASSTETLFHVPRDGADYSAIWGFENYGNAAQVAPVASKNIGTSKAASLTRLVFCRENGGDSIAIGSNGKAQVFGITNTGARHPFSAYGSSIWINGIGSSSGGSLTAENTTGLLVKRVAFWGVALTESQLFTISRFGRPGITLLGDSFIANGSLREALAYEIEDRGLGPVAIYEDGVGAVGLDAHATRYAALSSDLHDEYLIIMEGGWDNDYATSVSAIDSIVSNITHDRWAIVEPNPLNVLGDSRRDEWNDMFYGASDNTGSRAIYNYVGADHYIKTYDTMLANGDGTSTDNDRIATGLWPLNVTYDGTHPNTLGEELLTGLIADYAVANKWI